MGPAPLSRPEIDAALGSLPDWRLRAYALHAVYAFDTSATAIAFLADVGAAAEAADHHPDVDWRYRHVFCASTTHCAGNRVTARDTALAARIGELAAARGGRPEPALVRGVEIAVDCTDPAALEPVWAAALGYRRGEGGDLVDPWRRGPSVWFQRTATPAASRLHVDAHVAAGEAEAVLQRVRAAGAALTDERFAPAWWVLGDGDGNRLCLCTPAPRPDDGGRAPAGGGPAPGA
ncbi:4a-hydroxytetrahydrobiopterin dehydratase [Kineococcus glutinatus]|uniref:Putative pterin-4-alpha-carbinolamine dehydratase n=1 Tax=Kineococcus glutinatus TaxID=1070872 RepID=A0ABP9I4X6_9ACTN